MFRKVVFATDLSPASEKALDCISEWMASGLETVVVTHVHNIRHTGGLEQALRRDHEPKWNARPSASKPRDSQLHGAWSLACRTWT